MQNITFENISIPGHVEFENKLYRHYHYPKMLSMYDSNFIEFKVVPSLFEFKEAAIYLREFHLKKGQTHVKFYFPDNEKLNEKLINYLKEADYEYGYNELYAIHPNDFPIVDKHPYVEIKEVTSENLDLFLQLQYEQDLKFGEEFAKEKVGLHKQHFKDPSVLQLMAFYKGAPAGSVDIFIRENTVEIDSLNVLVDHQRKGIGGRLQQYVMERFPSKMVILVADGDDTPREMYRKQNYTYLGFKYEIQKIYQE
ncbi:GNAT family N-acetyltransferase [Virgibacillus sp. C22-A2]|uniref:GNAT family N-acetyltransferase n=1 Tax=Virgibacillus tibetensis TaxID=3042313 RepID=A0ABU6KK14_9BACI|nr:GNAT family N-acetyltransferase [Virgibacillus sp. C22-A2]